MVTLQATMTNQSNTLSYWSVKNYESYGNKYT